MIVGYDVFVHILPVTSRGAADKVATNILFQWVYEWNATNQGLKFLLNSSHSDEILKNVAKTDLYWVKCIVLKQLKWIKMLLIC